MLAIRLWTPIAAPALIGVGEEVTWEAHHFGIKQRLTVRITGFERDARFQDAMVSGAFKTMNHDHDYVPQREPFSSGDSCVLASQTTI
jgi:hypothetical protein